MLEDKPTGQHTEVIETAIKMSLALLQKHPLGGPSNVIGKGPVVAYCFAVYYLV